MLTSYKREGKAARQSRPQKASSRSGEVAEFTRPEGLLRFAAAVGCGGVKTPPYGAKDKRAVSAKLRAGHARPLQSCRSPLRGFGGTPEFKVEEGAGALRTKSNTAFV